MQGMYKYRYNSDFSTQHGPALKNGPEIAIDQVNDTGGATRAKTVGMARFHPARRVSGRVSGTDSLPVFKDQFQGFRKPA